jgi:hypothetical protein
VTAPLYVRMSAAPGVFAMSRATLYRAASRGDLTIHKRGGCSLLSVDQVRDWIENRGPSEPQKGGRLVGKSGAKR